MMGVRYTRIASRIWTDEKFEEFDTTTKLLYLYIISNHHCNMIGYYRLPKKYIKADLDLDDKQLDKAFSKLLDEQLIKYDDNRSIILVKNYLKYNTIQNINQAKGALKKLAELPANILVEEFKDTVKANLKQYDELFIKQLDKQFSKRYGNTVTETVTVTENTISFSENEKEDTDNFIKQIIDYLNLKNNSNYRYNSKKTISLIKARLKEGFIFNDFKTVIDNKVDEWENDNKMSKFLRPVTLFAEKFESYLNEKKFENNKTENNDDKFYLIEQIIAEGKYRSESQLHLLPEREANFIESLPCGFVTVNELSGNEFEYNKLKKQYKNFIKENI